MKELLENETCDDNAQWHLVRVFELFYSGSLPCTRLKIIPKVFQNSVMAEKGV